MLSSTVASPLSNQPTSASRPCPSAAPSPLPAHLRAALPKRLRILQHISPHHFSDALCLERRPPSVLARNFSCLRLTLSPRAPYALSTPLVLYSSLTISLSLRLSHPTTPADVFTVLAILPCPRQRRNEAPNALPHGSGPLLVLL
ncbi:hypothetical protein B0H11DRAFT_2246582 [Mycena galericulata]|nr:hypothetical protein B0H11DRAFT_2246582 [Mycena galericulata]